MKKLLCLLSVFGALVLSLNSCSDDDDDVAQAYITVASGSTFSPAAIDATGGAVTVSFSTNYSWKLSGYTSYEWLSFDKTSGDSGSDAFTVTASENETTASRTATFDILAGAASQTVTITQNSSTPEEFSVSPTAFEDIVATGAELEVTVTGSTDFTVTVPSDVDWITYEVSSSVITFVVAENENADARTATVTISSGSDSANVTFTQLGSAEATPTVWEEQFTTSSLSVIGEGTPFRLGIGDYLYMSNSSDIYAVNASTGAFISSLGWSTVSDVKPNSMVTDDAGNILVAATVACTTESADNFTVYTFDGSTATELLSYAASNFYTGNMGNLRVAGDVTKDAVVVAFVSGCTYFVAWQITNGTVGTPVTGAIPYENAYGVADVYYGCVCPISSSLEDGLVFIGYDDNYSLKYCADPTETGEGKPSWEYVWTEAPNAGNENYGCMSVATHNGKTYCAIGQGAHFTWSATPEILVLDITDMTNVQLVYSHYFPEYIDYFTSVGQDDVLLVSDNSELLLYYVDRGVDFATCLSFDEL